MGTDYENFNPQQNTKERRQYQEQTRVHHRQATAKFQDVRTRCENYQSRKSAYESLRSSGLGFFTTSLGGFILARVFSLLSFCLVKKFVLAGYTDVITLSKQTTQVSMVNKTF